MPAGGAKCRFPLIVSAPSTVALAAGLLPDAAAPAVITMSLLPLVSEQPGIPVQSGLLFATDIGVLLAAGLGVGGVW